MNGITFGNIHSFHDLNLIVAPFEESVPTVKENYIDVPGADGGLDLTAAFGEVKYNYREFDLTFSVLPSDNWERKKRQVTNLLHGLKCSIVFDRNPNYCLTGRVTVSERKSDRMNRQIVIHAKTAPYWRKMTDTVFTCTLGNSKNLAPRLNDWTIYESPGHENITFIKNDILTVNPGTYAHCTVPLSGNESELSVSFTANREIRCYYKFLNSSNDEISGNSFVSSSKKENITVPNNAAKFFFRFYPSGSSTTTIVSKVQIESGSSSTAYEPKDGILIQNENLPVIPDINVSSDITIYDQNKNSYSLSAGTHKILDISIPTGESIITATGSGNLTVKFTERAL